MEDYSDFGMESIQRSLREMAERIQRKTKATDIQMAIALSQAAKDFMNTNFLKEPRR
jgi:hypothetical protein